MYLSRVIENAFDTFTVYHFIVLFFTYILWRWLTTPNNLPPGPWGLPIVGYLPFITSLPHIKLNEVAKKYGKIYSIYLGNRLVILLNDFKVVKEAMIKQGEIFAGRPDSFPVKVFDTDIGIVTTEGEKFKTFKYFTLSTLKSAGALRSNLDKMVQENASYFIDYVHSLKGEAVDIREALGVSIAQTYTRLLLDREHSFDDPWLKKLINLFHREHRLYGNGLRIYLSWTRKVPFLSGLVGETQLRSVKEAIYSVLNEAVLEKEKSYYEGSTDNYLHSWFTADLERRRKNPDDKLFCRRHMLHNMSIMFSAGYETTTTSLLWAFIFFMFNPHVQERLYKEINETLTSEEAPAITLAAKMPYTQATIQEIHRLASIVPLVLPHANIQSAVLEGYNIPQRSDIIINNFAIHMNQDNFPDPEKFRPERFLDENGCFHKSEKVMPFGIGKRQCPGEQLAQVELFAYIVSIVRNFIIEKPEGENPTMMKRNNSLSSNPYSFKVRFVTRKASLENSQ